MIIFPQILKTRKDNTLLSMLQTEFKLVKHRERQIVFLLCCELLSCSLFNTIVKHTCVQCGNRDTVRTSMRNLGRDRLQERWVVVIGFSPSLDCGCS